MVTMKSIVLAASSLVSLTKASPLEPRAAEYRSYKGDGTIAQGWPAVSTWANFDSLWSANTASNAGDCRWLGLAPNSEAENNAIKAAILKAGSDSGLDPRFILAAVFQESAGCVRVKTSYSPNLGIRNPGLLQGPNGDHTCNDPEAGVPMLNPCPDEQINGMITDGVGITTNDGLKQTIERSKATDDSKYYKGAVIYNSGLLPESGNLGQGRSNPCYASDIANRVMGWVADGASPCDRDTIGDL